MDIPGLLGRLAGLPGAINQGLLGSMPVDPRLGLDPQMLQQARQGAGTDFAMGLVAGGNDPRTLLASRQNATAGFRERVFDALKEQELLRINDERERRKVAGDNLRATLPAEMQPLAEVAGMENVAGLLLEELFRPPAKQGEPPAAVKIAQFLTDPTVSDDQKKIVRQQITPQQSSPGPTNEERLAWARYPNDKAKREQYLAQLLDSKIQPQGSVDEQIKAKVRAGGVEALDPGEKALWDRMSRQANPFAEMLSGAMAGQQQTGPAVVEWKPK